MGKLTLNPDGVFLGFCFNPTTRQFNIFTLQCQDHIAWRNLIGLHFSGVQPDAHLPQAQPVENDVADAIDALKLFFQYFIGVSGKIAHGSIARKVHK